MKTHCAEFATWLLESVYYVYRPPVFGRSRFLFPHNKECFRERVLLRTGAAFLTVP